MTESRESLRINVTLKGSANWREWINTIKNIAECNGLWKYIDPEPKDPETFPPKPPIPEPHDVLPGLTLAELHRQGISYQLDELRLKWKIEKDEWTALDARRRYLHSAVQSSLSAENKLIIENETNTRNVLCMMRDRYAQTNHSRKRDLIKQLHELKRAPRSGIEAWITRWETTYTQARQLDLPEATDPFRPLYEFLDAVVNLSPGFYSYWTNRLTEIADSDDKPPGLHTLLKKYTDYTKSNPPHFQARYANATLMGESDDVKDMETGGSDEKKQAAESKSGKGRKHTKCPCQGIPDDGNHQFDKCPYVNPAIRPANWVADDEAKTRFDLARKHPGFRKAHNMALKKYETKEERSDENDDNRQYVGAAMAQLNYDNATRDIWAYDTGSSLHICNNRHLFETYKEADGQVYVGDTSTAIKGYGQVAIRPTTSLNNTVWVLRNVAYAPGFHINLISAKLMQSRSQIYLNGRRLILEDKEGKPVCGVNVTSGLYLIKWNQSNAAYLPLPELASLNVSEGKSNLPRNSDSQNQVANLTNSHAKPVEKQSLGVFHARFNHLNYEALSHVQSASTGVQILDDTIFPHNCVSCLKSSAPRQISRRPMRTDGPPFETISWDLIIMTPSYRGTRYLSHTVCNSTKWQSGEDVAYKSDATKHIDGQCAYYDTQFGLRVKAMHCDGETALYPWVLGHCRERGIAYYPTPPHQSDQNPYAEKYGHLIAKGARQLLDYANLPAELWPEAVQALIWLANRLPVKALGWISPYEAVKQALPPNVGRMDDKPDLANVRIFGCRAYARDVKVIASHKMKPRALIGYLVGYEALNIWRIWLPKQQRVIRARDVVFDETTFYSPTDPENDYPVRESDQSLTNDDDVIASLIDAIDVPEESIEFESTNQERVFPRKMHYDIEVNGDPDYMPSTPGSTTSASDIESDKWTHPATDTSSTANNDNPPQNEAEPTSPDVIRPIVLIDNSNINPDDYRIITNDNLMDLDLPQGIKRPAEDNLSDENDLVLKQHRVNVAWPYQYVFNDMLTDLPNQLNVAKAPPPPEEWRYLEKHPYRRQFEEAMKAEFDKLDQMKTWQVVKASQIEEDHIKECLNNQAKELDFGRKTCPKHQIVPLKWVFAYKTDALGNIERFKARLCVRGDMQRRPEDLDIRTTTLAARTFRCLLAIVAAFDLETWQMDAVNAYLNSWLNHPIYCHFPPGMGRNANKLKIVKALYGLPEAGKRWQDDIRETLLSLHLKPCPDDPALYSDHQMIVMVFVDDFFAVYPKKASARAEAVKAALQQRYQMKDCGELTQFIGVRIVRDRSTRRLWINQASYIEKLIGRFNIPYQNRVKTPLPSAFNMHDEPGDSNNTDTSFTTDYQQKIGSTLYAAVWTRPDTAWSNQVLSRRLTKPALRHMKAANHLLTYLYQTKDLSICYDGLRQSKSGKVFEGFSDASYADNSDRKSSAGYVFTLYGGPVDWVSQKQKVITTSTTEAELLALSAVARQSYWMKRLFSFITFDPIHEICLYCDNKQTVDLLNAERSIYRSKLRHIDIAKLWIVQEISAGRLKIRWIKSSDQSADGLTKQFTAAKQQAFINQLGMQFLPAFARS